MPTKKKYARDSAEVVWLTAAQVLMRYGNRSHMWLERILVNDPTFPRPAKFGVGPQAWRYFKLTDLEAWERAKAAA